MSRIMTQDAVAYFEAAAIEAEARDEARFSRGARALQARLSALYPEAGAQEPSAPAVENAPSHAA